MKWMVVSIALILAASRVVACPITHAVYHYREKPGVTARFLPWSHKSLTDVFLTIESTSHQKIWFTLDAGNGYTTQKLISSKTDPGLQSWIPQDPDSNKDRLLNDMAYYLFDKSMRVIDKTPDTTMSAPAYLFIPDLGMELWYSARDASIFSNVELPRALFVMDGCAA
jgi:hypothetical protein